MRPGRALALVALVPLAALAAEWVKVPTPDAHQHWYDRSKLVFEGETVTYWRRVAFRSPQRSKGGLATSAMYRERIDCRTHTSRTLGYLLYARDGSVIENVRTPDAEPEPVTPDTLGDQYEKVMCALLARYPREPLAPAASAIPPSTQELRDEIEWLEARLRILRAQLEQRSDAGFATTGQPAAPSQPAH